MEKAKIHILDSEGKDIIDTFEVMFNPTEYSNSIEVDWEGDKGKIPQFKGSNFSSFSITLFFDSYEYGVDVREDHEIVIDEENEVKKEVIGTKRIVELAVPSAEGQESKKPPVCLFSWGKFNFKGVIEKVDQNFTMFLPDGIPVRAKVTIAMKPVVNAKDMLKMKGIEACRKVRIVKEGERLDIIAAEELKDPAAWYKIAEANDIADPLNFPTTKDTGKVIIIPDQGS